MTGGASSPRACPVCESVGPREILHRQQFYEGPLGEGYNVVVCGECGAGFADNIPNQDELDRYYMEQSKYTYDYAGGAESPYDFKRFEAIADQLEPYLLSKAARILDIGCATGGLLAVLMARGYTNVLGSDPSPACREAAHRLYSIDVRTAALAEHVSWSDRFDCILLVGVIEHLRDVPVGLRVVASLLKPSGLLYSAQPDVEAFADCRNAPYQQFSTEHINFFSSESLVRAMESVGLEARNTRRWMFEWREGVTDSVVSGLFSPQLARTAKERHRPGIEHTSKMGLRRYLDFCRLHEAAISAQIDDLVVDQQPILIWGTGSLTRRLLLTTSLAKANIAAFVNSSQRGTDAWLIGRPIVGPDQLSGHSAAILVASKAFEAEICATIRNKLGLQNEIITLAGRIRQ